MLRALFISVCAAALTGMPCSAIAQETAAAPGIVSDEIVVTAQRREQALSDVPVSVQAFTSATLERAQIDTVDDLARISPSMQFSSGFSPSSSGFLIRGVSSRAITGYQQGAAAVVIDGVPVVNQGEFVSDLNDLQRIEVLRGPQGTLFGKNATAGVLNIVQQAPSNEIEGRVEAGYTTDDEANLRAMLNVGGAAAWVRVNAFWRELQPLFDNLHPGDDDIGASEHWGFQAKLSTDFTPDLHWLATIGYHQGQDSFGQLVPTVAISTLPLGPLFGPEQIARLGYTPTRETTHVNVNSNPWNQYEGPQAISELTWDVSEDWTLTSLTGYRQFNYGVSFDIDSGPVGATLGYPIVTDPTGNGADGFLPDGGILFGAIGSPSREVGEFNPFNHIEYWSQEFRANFSNERWDVVTGVFYQDVDVDAGSGAFLAASNAFLLATGSTGCNTAVGATDYCLFPAASNGLTGRYQLNDKTWAVFADASYHWTEEITTFLGLRYTSEEMDFNRDARAYFPLGSGFDFWELSQALDVESGQWLVAALPVSIEANRQDEDLSGRIGLQWEPTPAQNYYIAYSRAYKGPGVDVDFATGPADLFVEPETGISLEIGTKQRLLDGKVLFNLAIFDQTIEDVQVSTIVPGSVATRLFNAGDLEMTGVEIEGRVNLTGNWSADGAVAWLDAEHVADPSLVNGCYDPFAGDPRCEDRDGNPLNGAEVVQINGHRPQNTSEWRYTVNLNYDRQLNAIPFSVSARLGWTWQSEIGPALTGPDPLATPGDMGFLDAAVTLASDDGRWDLTVFGKNLTDELGISTMAQNEPVIARVYNIYGREFHRYGGIQIRSRF